MAAKIDFPSPMTPGLEGRPEPLNHIWRQYLSKWAKNFKDVENIDIPTGTGFRHMTSGTEDASAKLVENADVDASAAIAESKLALDYATSSLNSTLSSHISATAVHGVSEVADDAEVVHLADNEEITGWKNFKTQVAIDLADGDTFLGLNIQSDYEGDEIWNNIVDIGAKAGSSKYVGFSLSRGYLGKAYIYIDGSNDFHITDGDFNDLFETSGYADSAISAHAALTTNVHGFDASGNAPPQAHQLNGAVHTSSATPGQIFKADANGLPVDATNTDAEIAAAVSASHAAATISAAPLTISGQEITFNYDTDHFELDTNNLQIKNLTTVGQSFITTANPSAVTYPRVNIDNTVTYRSAEELASDTCPMTTLGDWIVGGAAGAPSRFAGNSADNSSALTQSGNGATVTGQSWTAISDSGAASSLVKTDGSGYARAARLGVGLSAAPSYPIHAYGDWMMYTDADAPSRQTAHYIGVGDSGTVGFRAGMRIIGGGTYGFATALALGNFASDVYDSTWTARLTIEDDGYLNVTGATGLDASSAVVTDESENLTSMDYTEVGAADSIVKTDGDGSIVSGLDIGLSGEIFRASSGLQIRCADSNHRIVFDQSNNTLDLIEYGTINLSPGATTSVANDKFIFDGSGQLTVAAGGKVITPDIQVTSVTASQAAVFDASKNLSSIAYSDSGAASNLARITSSGALNLTSCTLEDDHGVLLLNSSLGSSNNYLNMSIGTTTGAGTFGGMGWTNTGSTSTNFLSLWVGGQNPAVVSSPGIALTQTTTYLNNDVNIPDLTASRGLGINASGTLASLASYEDDAPTGNVTFTNGYTWYDVATVSLSAGTWDLDSVVWIYANDNDDFQARIYNDTDSTVIQSSDEKGLTQYEKEQFVVGKVVVLTGTKTIKLQAQTASEGSSSGYATTYSTLKAKQITPA
jgi:hypothetical protein